MSGVIVAARGTKVVWLREVVIGESLRVELPCFFTGKPGQVKKKRTE